MSETRNRKGGAKKGSESLSRRYAKNKRRRPTRFKRFLKDVTTHTPFIQLIVVLILLRLIFSTGMYFAERGVQGAGITSFGGALYWGIAAQSTEA